VTLTNKRNVLHAHDVDTQELPTEDGTVVDCASIRRVFTSALSGLRIVFPDPSHNATTADGCYANGCMGASALHHCYVIRRNGSHVLRRGSTVQTGRHFSTMTTLYRCNRVHVNSLVLEFAAQPSAHPFRHRNMDRRSCAQPQLTIL
jgi:hypothetical protein